MQTIISNLKEMSHEIQMLLEDILLNHSSIYFLNEPGGSVVVISAYGNYAYKELKEEGRQLQAKLLEKYRCFYSLVSVLLKGQPKDTLGELSQANKEILRIIEQTRTWCKTTQEVLEKATQALLTHLILLNRLYDPSEHEATYVPDTNALLYNTNLEDWEFSETPNFTIALLPTVLSELDLLKVNHRNEAVRNKAEKLIRMIKEYRRRGKLTTGVTLVKGKSQIQALAIEPVMKESLPWLDSNNNDDRFLAGVIEVIRSRPRSLVIAVSRDINFQNKAEFANIPFVEPPEHK